MTNLTRFAALAFAVIFSAPALAGWSSGWFDDPAIQACEWFTVQRLQSPSSYNRIGSSMLDNQVLIEFDAQNAFGALIRHKTVCTFRYFDGEFEMMKPEDLTGADGELL